MLWSLAASFPSLLLYAVDTAEAFVISQGHGEALSAKVDVCRTLAVAFSLVLQGLLLVMVLRWWPGHRDKAPPAGYYAPPSARYEELSGATTGMPSSGLDVEVRFKLWTWANFVTFTGLWYFSLGYLGLLLLAEISGLWGASGEWVSRWRLPAILVTGETARSVEGIVLTCLMGVPLGVGVLRGLRARVQLLLWNFQARDLATDSAAMKLPEPPLKHLAECLGVRALDVALIPRSSIEVSVGTTTMFRKEYRLDISAGALSRLSKEEMESLLWHECHHARLLRWMRRRHLLSLLAPASARLLDLAEDLYQEERDADRYAAKQMGTAAFLISALAKLRQQAHDTEAQAACPQEGKPVRWTDFFKPLGDSAWAGYLHPDLDQRIRWLEVPA
jgi:Zn-dependent protease with chaperone function